MRRAVKSPAHPCLISNVKYRQFLGELGEVALALWGQAHHIFYTYAKLSGNIYTRLDGDYVVHLENSGVGAVGTGIFMYLKTQGMTELLALCGIINI